VRPENIKQQVVEEFEFKDIRLTIKHVAEFVYRPVACDRDYRVIVVWKTLAIHQGHQRLFDDAKAFFYITNDRKTSHRGGVVDATRIENNVDAIKRNYFMLKVDVRESLDAG
jgi:hypothetical protein